MVQMGMIHICGGVPRSIVLTWLVLCAQVHVTLLIDGKETQSAVTVVDQPDNGQPYLDDAVVETEETVTKHDVFYPTKEWQTVLPGQPIPQGLHVRLNLETGSREAKLLDDDPGDLKYWNKDGRQGMLNSKSKAFSHEELKHALKKFQTTTFTDKASKENAEKVKKKFRSYDALKEELNAMNMQMKTEAEIVIEFVNALKVGTLTDEEKSNVLMDLEYYVHQIDSAVVFCDVGGMAIVLQFLNSTHHGLRKEAASVVGAAVRSNPKAQIKALEVGVLSQLLRLLAIDDARDRQKAYLFAVSSLVTQFPYAQKEFLKLGGLSALSALFNQDNADVLRLKVVTLLHDLLIEKESVMNDAGAIDDKKRQYSELPLLESLVAGSWCDGIPTLLSQSRHDTNEKTLQAMNVLLKHCQQSFKKAMPTLEMLQSDYAALATQETDDSPSGDEYFTSIHQYIDNILKVLRKSKDEL